MQPKNQRNHRRRRSKVNCILKLINVPSLLMCTPVRPLSFISHLVFPEKPGHVQFQSVPIDISLSTASTDDAYDFNTDFK